jgi:hypothetical protein
MGMVSWMPPLGLQLMSVRTALTMSQLDEAGTDIAVEDDARTRAEAPFPPSSQGPFQPVPPAHAPSHPSERRDHKAQKKPKSKASRSAPAGIALTPRQLALMQIVVSLVALVAGIYVIITSTTDMKTAAAGWVGLVVGYWLR